MLVERGGRGGGVRRGDNRGFRKDGGTFFWYAQSSATAVAARAASRAETRNVRRKAPTPRPDPVEGHIINMSRRTNAGILSVMALLCAGIALFWLHNRVTRTQAGMAHSGVANSNGTNNPIDTTTPTDIRSADTKGKTTEPQKAPAEKDPPGPLRAGEVLEYTAHVATLNNVANLRVSVAERRNFLGTNAWHFQAVARTENPLRMVFALDY